MKVKSKIIVETPWEPDSDELDNFIESLREQNKYYQDGVLTIRKEGC